MSTTKTAAKLVKSFFVGVTSTGVTFQATTTGVLLGGTAPLSPRMSKKLKDGSLLVTTPHQAGGAFMERGAGGIYPAIKTSAKLRTLREQIENDPRGTTEQKAELITAIFGN